VVSQDEPPIDAESFAREAITGTLEGVGTDPRFRFARSQSLAVPDLVTKSEVRSRVRYLRDSARGVKGRGDARRVIGGSEGHDVDSEGRRTRGGPVVV
jgi:hypothetical protein